MILVYQMAKVASRSWIEAALPVDRSVVHCHFIVPENRKRIARAYDVPVGQRTIANMLMPANLLRGGGRVWDQLQAAHAAGRPVRMITGVRDPVARSISLIMFMADFYGHVSRPLNPRNPPSAGYIIEALQRMWASVLAEIEPEQSFEWLWWYLTCAYRRWFEEELFAATGVDVLAYDYRPGQLIAGKMADILVYRVEDMRPGTQGHTALLAAASAFLGRPMTELPMVNTGDTRRSRDISSAVRRGFFLPDDVLDEIYTTESVRHFYTAAEIDGFKARWRTR